MPGRNASADQDDAERVVGGRTAPPTIAERIAAFAMLDGMANATQAEKCMRLSLVGFSNAEIAAMLQTTNAVVSTNLYEQRKKAKRGPRDAS